MNKSQAEDLLYMYSLVTVVPSVREKLREPEVLDNMFYKVFQSQGGSEFTADKLHRWVGFVQGVLYSDGVRTVEGLKEDVRKAKIPRP
jgi:hypothetical protein